MARLARVVIPDLPHHVVQRGNRRLTTFFNDDDYAAYLALLAAQAERAESTIAAYCLMPNHVHLIIVPTTTDGLRATVAETNRKYTRRINLREGWQGHLWQERFHSTPLDEAGLLQAARYVELNPVRAKLVQRPEEWRWSSARAHLTGASEAPLAIAPLPLSPAHWRDYLATEVDAAEMDRLRRHARTGRPLGEPEFVAALEERTGRRLAPQRPGRPRGEK